MPNFSRKSRCRIVTISVSNSRVSAFGTSLSGRCVVASATRSPVVASIMTTRGVPLRSASNSVWPVKGMPASINKLFCTGPVTRPRNSPLIAAIHRALQRGLHVGGIAFVELPGSQAAPSFTGKYQQLTTREFVIGQTVFAVFDQRQRHTECGGARFQQVGIGDDDKRDSEGARIGKLHAQVRTDAGRFAGCQGKNSRGRRCHRGDAGGGRKGLVLLASSSLARLRRRLHRHRRRYPHQQPRIPFP